jgi:hypothetical protein
LGQAEAEARLQQRLTEPEFARALKRGQGRALQYVREYGVEGVADHVLDACLKNLAYDPQCEDDRSEWLFQMFKGSVRYAWFAGEVRSALKRAEDGHDLNQLCNLAALMASRGDRQAAALLRSQVLGQDFTDREWPRGLQALVALDGEGAIIEIAHRVGRTLLTDAAAGLPTLESLSKDRDLLAKARVTLYQLEPKDKPVAAFLTRERNIAQASQSEQARTQDERQAELRERARNELSLEKILEDADQKIGNMASRYIRFGRYATVEERKTILERLAAETSEDVCLRLLWVFRRSELPELHTRVWELTESENRNLRAAAIVALAQCRDVRVGDFGRRRLKAKDFSEADSEVFDIFIRNFEAPDVELISAALCRLSPDDDAAHAVGISILAIGKENGSATLSEALKWVYVNTPCALCRSDSLKQMIARDCFPPEILSECLYDADKDTRQAAQERLGVEPTWRGS